MEIWKTSQKLHSRVTKKDPGLPFHFHVLNWFKSWSNLGFDQDSNGHKKFKKWKKWKTKAHSLIMSNSKHSSLWTRSRNIQTRKIVYLPPNPELCLMKSSMKRSGFGFQTWKFQKPPKSFILVWLRRIQAYFFIFMF